MDPAPKQQIVERIKQANNILVTVSNNPSVDQLAACIGFTLLLNKMDKHGTAVFSGKVPSTLEFLQPDKTIEQNTDSLRDFIISLDKSKADKLRYKVEDQVVRIFITPYRTNLSEQDLIFSQGDFNVEVVIALGVHDNAQLDGAITAHGRILHDATVISVNAGEGGSNIGSLNWQEPTASSLCEMLVSMSEAFGSGLLDNQMATAFLTGIVAETERFSNPKTTPKVMTMSAQLMAAGANQQLIATKLAEPVREDTPAEGVDPASTDGSLNIAHSKGDEKSVELNPDEIHIDEHGNLKTPEEIMAEAASKDKKRGMIEPLAPLSEPSKTDSRPVLDSQGKPDRGGTLSANTKPEEYGGTTDPMSQGAKDQPIMDHTLPPPVPPADDHSTPQEPPKPDPAPEPPKSPESPTPPAPLIMPAEVAEPPKPEPAPSPAPDPAAIPPELSAIAAEFQKSASAPELPSTSGAMLGPDPNPSEDAARHAVASAVQSEDQPTLGPIAALNSQPLGPELHHDGHHTIAPPPPIVPPVMPSDDAPTTSPAAPAPEPGMPTFTIPSLEVPSEPPADPASPATPGATAPPPAAPPPIPVLPNNANPYINPSPTDSNLPQ